MADRPRLRVRAAGPADAEPLSRLGGRTFLDTYTRLGHPVPAMIAHYAAEMFACPRIEEELSLPGTHYLVAEEESGVLAGYAKLIEKNPPEIAEAGGYWFVERLYLDALAEGRGSGRLLLAETESYARERGAPGLWLTVWEDNRKAFGFFTAMGFRHVGVDEWKYEWEGRQHVDVDELLVKRFAG